MRAMPCIERGTCIQWLGDFPMHVGEGAAWLKPVAAE